ncbi:hypothetical protein DPEC_G00338970 [Dallia pectoralis]|uniref:Uncharacterized protein n=1 Tax=Dallia pectoralis TaxID=75939 RepID=A0ACC2F4P6_DALPE|nr:hypothetical protein DPEC_G00338970 [Dallia pectoralis]
MRHSMVDGHITLVKASYCHLLERLRNEVHHGIIFSDSMSQPSRSHQGGGERNGREQRTQRKPPHSNRQPSSSRSSSQAPYYRDSANQVRSVQSGEQSDSKCTHICSRRGMVLLCSILTNALVLVCVVAAQMAMSGMTAMGGLSGGFNLDTNIPFEGQELQQVRNLDMLYSQMRAPGVYGGVAFALVFGVLSLVFVVSGNKPAHLLGPRLLIGALVFQAVGAVLYVVAVGLYLHFVIQVNSTDTCNQRARMYARVGFTWMNCDVGGADAAVALFGLITAILYGVGTVLVFFTERGVQNYLKERRQHKERATKTVDKTKMSDSSRSPLSV